MHFCLLLSLKPLRIRPMRTCSRNLLFLGLAPRARFYLEFSRILMDLPGVSLAD